MAQCFDLRPRLGVATAALLLVLVPAAAPPAAAQLPIESAGGTRALGMGGAFTAVADDASATWWNPAGLPTLLADAVVEGGADRLIENGSGPVGSVGAWRARPMSVAVAFPMAGISFNRLTLQEIRPSATDAPGPGRQDPAARVRAVGLSSFGVTLVQSLGDYVAAGGTVRLVRGGLASAPLSPDSTTDTGLDAADALDVRGRTVADADIGVMAFAGPVRLALVGRHLAAHRFESGVVGEAPFRLARSVRAGAAIGPAPAWNRRAWTLALDADLTTTRAADGERRALAVGAERWLDTRQRVGLRAGARVQTVGDPRPVASGGASVAVRAGMYVEGQVSGGGDRAGAGWGLAARVTF